MGLGHLFGVGIGAGSIALSRYFWTGMCYSIAITYETLDQALCDGFKTFFLIFGIISIIVSIYGFIKG